MNSLSWTIPDWLLNALASIIREQRELNGTGLGELATKIGLSRDELASIETGSSSISARLLSKIAYGLGIQTSILIRWAELKVAEQPKGNKGWQDNRDAYNCAPCGFLSVDSDNLITRVNDTELSWLGLARKDVLFKKHLRELVAPPNQDLVDKLVKTATSEQYLAATTIDLARSDGTIFQSTANVISKPEGDGTRAYTHFSIFDRRIDLRQRRWALEYDVHNLLSQPGDLKRYADLILRSICLHFSWDIGFLWACVDPSKRISVTAHWHRPELPASKLVTMSREMIFRPGMGLIGQALTTREPEAVLDVRNEPNYLRATAVVECNLSSAFWFPVLTGDETVGVFEFYSQEQRTIDDDMMLLMTSLSSTIAQSLAENWA